MSSHDETLLHLEVALLVVQVLCLIFLGADQHKSITTQGVTNGQRSNAPLTALLARDISACGPLRPTRHPASSLRHAFDDDLSSKFEDFRPAAEVTLVTYCGSKI